MFYFNYLLRKINHVRTFPIFHVKKANYFRDKKQKTLSHNYIDMHTLLLVSNQKHLLIFITLLLEYSSMMHLDSPTFSCLVPLHLEHERGHLTHKRLHASSDSSNVA